jgi:hypothetical protein
MPTKDFREKKLAGILPAFERRKNFKSPDFYNR